MSEARRAARKAAQAAKSAQEQEDRLAICEAARAILRDDNATPAQRLAAICIVDEIEHYFIIRYSMHSAGNALMDFSAALKAATEDTAT